MAESSVYRCYYDDGTVITVPVPTGTVINDACPLVNDNGSSLVTSELTIIEDVTQNKGWPWLLLILALVYLRSKRS